jgi:RNA polymerase primary sigma factor
VVLVAIELSRQSAKANDRTRSTSTPRTFFTRPTFGLRSRGSPYAGEHEVARHLDLLADSAKMRTCRTESVVVQIDQLRHDAAWRRAGKPQQRLSRQREQELVVAAEAGDPASCHELVEAFLPAIASLARSYHRSIGVERKELIQEGVAGLLFAAQRYDTGLETPFWPYASFWVRKAMQELVAELTRPIALSDRAVRCLAQIRTARRDHLQAHGVEPTTSDLSQATGLTPPQVESLLAAERAPRSFEEPLRPNDEATVTLGDTIADPVAERAYELVLDEIEIREVRDLADQLDERERMVIKAHYGLGRPTETLSEIGATLGLTAERARQIEVGGLTKLRAALADPALP